MNYGHRRWVPLKGVTRYVSYAPVLVVRQLEGVQHVPRTNGFFQFSRLFKDQSVLEIIVESGIKQYERLYKKHLMLESELTEAKTKWKAFGVFKTNLDKMRDEIGRNVHQYEQSMAETNVFLRYIENKGFVFLPVTMMMSILAFKCKSFHQVLMKKT